MRKSISRSFVLLLLVSSFAAPAMAQTLPIDDFKTGPYFVRLASGETSAYQTGTMIGGNRFTTLKIASNPFGQTGSLHLRRGLMVANADAGVWESPQLYYGQSSTGPVPLDEVLTPYDAFRINFRSNAQSLTVSILVFTTGSAGYLELSKNISASFTDFSEDFLFDDFTAGGTGADWSDIDAIWINFQTLPLGAGDFVVDSVEAITLTP